MLTVALTGGIGCGKSSVSQYFSELGAGVVDNDVIARQQVEPGQPALNEIIREFGQNICLADGSLNRTALAKIVFNDSVARLKLEAILHPYIRQSTQQQIAQLDSSYAIIAIPLLFETQQQHNYDRILVVDCDKQQQRDRTLARDHRSEQEIEAIIKSQISRNKRLAMANDIIDNSRDKAYMQTQINKLHSLYLSLANKQ